MGQGAMGGRVSGGPAVGRLVASLGQFVRSGQGGGAQDGRLDGRCQTGAKVARQAEARRRATTARARAIGDARRRTLEAADDDMVGEREVEEEAGEAGSGREGGECSLRRARGRSGEAGER